MKTQKCKARKCRLLLIYAGKEKCCWSGWPKPIKDLKTCPLENPNRNKDYDSPYEDPKPNATNQQQKGA